jgi:hypothetical protein
MMGFSGILNLLQQYAGATASSASGNTQQDFENVAQHATPSHLAQGLAQAFRSDQTPAFTEMVGNLFRQSNPQQRAGLLNQLLGAAPGGLGSLASGGLATLLEGRSQVTPEQAEALPAESVEQLAQQAQQNNPSIVDQVSRFYAEHPTVVKALGAGALALIMSHMYDKRESA